MVWDVKEPTHYSIRVGDVVPGVVVRPYLDEGIFHFLKLIVKLRNKQSS